MYRLRKLSSNVSKFQFAKIMEATELATREGVIVGSGAPPEDATRETTTVLSVDRTDARHLCKSQRLCGRTDPLILRGHGVLSSVVHINRTIH